MNSNPPASAAISPNHLLKLSSENAIDSGAIVLTNKGTNSISTATNGMVCSNILLLKIILPEIIAEE